LALVLVILVAIQAVLASRVWVYPYARVLMPDVIRTEHGLVFPPQTTADNHSVVDRGDQ
jgi:hypothetical protein